MSAFTQKHYEALQVSLANTRREFLMEPPSELRSAMLTAWECVVIDLGDLLAADNAKFKWSMFHAACKE